MNRIVYVGPGGDLFTVSGDGSDPQQLTGSVQVERPEAEREAGAVQASFTAQSLNFNQFYAWPTWSPDGTKLAVSRVQLQGERNASVTIEIIDPVTGRAERLYSNEMPALIADGVPHYLYWAPNSRSLGFIASTPRGLTLFVLPIGSGEQPTSIETGAPLYFSWAGDSSAILLHSGQEIKRISLPVSGSPPENLGADQGFRAPAYSPDGQQVAYATAGTLKVGISGDHPDLARSILDIGSFSSFMWSPDGTHIAVADRTTPAGPAFQRLRVVDLSGDTGIDKEALTVVDEDLMAFYWSPDGRSLAWIGLDAEQRLFLLKVSDSAGSNPRQLFQFQPSGEFFTLLSFFDQYAYSHFPWSPDSSHLVVAGSPEQAFERRNGHTPTGSRVFILDAKGDQAPLEIAAGTLAFWSQN